MREEKKLTLLFTANGILKDKNFRPRKLLDVCGIDGWSVKKVADNLESLIAKKIPDLNFALQAARCQLVCDMRGEQYRFLRHAKSVESDYSPEEIAAIAAGSGDEEEVEDILFYLEQSEAAEKRQADLTKRSEATLKEFPALLTEEERITVAEMLIGILNVDVGPQHFCFNRLTDTAEGSAVTIFCMQDFNIWDTFGLTDDDFKIPLAEGCMAIDPKLLEIAQTIDEFAVRFEPEPKEKGKKKHKKEKKELKKKLAQYEESMEVLHWLMSEYRLAEDEILERVAKKNNKASVSEKKAVSKPQTEKKSPDRPTRSAIKPAAKSKAKTAKPAVRKTPAAVPSGAAEIADIALAAAAKAPVETTVTKAAPRRAVRKPAVDTAPKTAAKKTAGTAKSSAVDIADKALAAATQPAVTTGTKKAS